MNNLLLSLMLSFEIKENELITSEQILSLLNDKLGSSMGAVIRKPRQKIENIIVLPHEFKEKELWKALLEQIEGSFEKTGILIQEVKLENIFFYIFNLENYGYLILGSELPFSKELLAGLKSVFSIQGKLLALVSENEQRKAVEENLDSLKYLASKTTDVIIITDVNGYITYVNKAYETLTEYTFEEVIGKRPSNLVHGPETDPETKNRIKQAILELKTIKEEILNYSKSKRKYWQSITVDPIFNQEGKCIAYISLNKDITELKIKQKELERLSLVARNSKQGVYFSGPDFKITYANEALFKLTGYDEEEVLGKSSQELFQGPLTQSDFIKLIENGTKEIKPVEIDLILYRKDKSWFWANIKKQPLEKQEKEEQEFFSIIENISEKKLAEETLRNSQSRLSSLISNLKSSILLEDEDRKIVLVNSNFCSMFNIPLRPEELTGNDCSQSAEQSKHFFTNPEQFVKRIDEILREKKSVLNEEIKLVTGEYYERDYIPIIINDISKGHLWKYTDITERKNQERNLKQEEEKYRNIIANMKMGLLETDNDDIISYVNQQACEMTGYSSDEMIGKKSVDLLVPDEFKQKVKEKGVLRLKGISDNYQTKVKIKNGEHRWWLTSGGPNFNDKGIQIGTIGISVDITDQKNIEEELEIARKRAEESSHAKESFLAHMSHEIRTPLNAIIGMVREISREQLTTNQTLYAKNAAFASQHLLSIVNDILDIAKIESGQINLDLRPFSLLGVINDTISILTPSAHEKMLEIKIMTSPMLAPVYIGDSNRIGQILINIINNSIKFTETGSISLECSVTDKGNNLHNIHLKISDTGIGMDESFLNNIFDKFSQDDLAGGRKSEGTGLGMAITHQLVQLMNGTIALKSKKGVGTITEINLELEVTNEKEIKFSNEPESFFDLKHKKILLVEDNVLNRMVANNSLHYYDINVTEATNGLEAIEILKEKSFDLILMDLQMPVMGGIEATIAIRQKMKITTPIVALTAHAFKAEIERCLNSGMNDYIIKPFDENAFFRTIQKNISKTDNSSSSSDSEEIPDKNLKLYDLSSIIQMSRGNKDFINKIVQIFIEQTPAAVEEIKAAWEARDLVTIRSVAHRIKPNLANFGIVQLEKEIRSIESLADQRLATPELEAKIFNLEKIINNVVKELAKEIF